MDNSTESSCSRIGKAINHTTLLQNSNGTLFTFSNLPFSCKKSSKLGSALFGKQFSDIPEKALVEDVCL